MRSRTLPRTLFSDDFSGAGTSDFRVERAPFPGMGGSIRWWVDTWAVGKNRGSVAECGSGLPRRGSRILPRRAKPILGGPGGKPLFHFRGCVAPLVGWTESCRRAVDGWQRVGRLGLAERHRLLTELRDGFRMVRCAI